MEIPYLLYVCIFETVKPVGIGLDYGEQRKRRVHMTTTYMHAHGKCWRIVFGPVMSWRLEYIIRRLTDSFGVGIGRPRSHLVAFATLSLFLSRAVLSRRRQRSKQLS